MILPASFSPEIHRHPTLISTNSTARELAIKGAAEGTVVIAEQQTGGRGSNNRVWHSPKGGLYTSILLYPKERTRATDLSFLAGVAAAQAVKDFLPKSKDVSVKWPNDCLIDWKKVCGILCENLGENYGNICVIGIGINVNVAKEELGAFGSQTFPATSFIIESEGGSFDVERVFQTLLTKLFDLYRLYKTQGFEPIRYLWERNCRLIGKLVELREIGYMPKDGTRGITVGRFSGIDEAGAIVLTNEKGEHHHYYSGEISCFWR